MSLKTQELYAIIFIARYLDIFTNHLSIYLTIMKLIFIASTIYIIYLMRFQYKKTYSKTIHKKVVNLFNIKKLLSEFFVFVHKLVN
ncbi:MAG: hypothetical protein EOO43_25050, partial [Flavobacterium sp.]